MVSVNKKGPTAATGTRTENSVNFENGYYRYHQSPKKTV